MLPPAGIDCGFSMTEGALLECRLGLLACLLVVRLATLLAVALPVTFGTTLLNNSASSKIPIIIINQINKQINFYLLQLDVLSRTHRSYPK